MQRTVGVHDCVARRAFIRALQVELALSTHLCRGDKDDDVRLRSQVVDAKMKRIDVELIRARIWREARVNLEFANCDG